MSAPRGWALVGRYGAFAVVATLVNLGLQRLVLAALGTTVVQYLIALVLGTGAGLVVKYLLDKRWIFADFETGARAHGRKFTLYTVKKGRDQMAALFLSPASEKGRATLRLGDNLWLYIPNVGKPLRITSLQSVVGGVFNNSDLLRLEFSTEYDVDSLAEDDGKHLLNLKAKSRNVAYDHLKMWVEKDSLLPVTIECYAASGLLIKTLHYSKVEDFGNGLRRPSQLITDSPLQKGYKSVMLFAKMKARPLDDEVFTLNYLPRLDELR